MSIENSIREHRARLVITQEELAIAVGVTRQTIIAIEANKYSPSLGLAFAIADALGVTVADVFTAQTS